MHHTQNGKLGDGKPRSLIRRRWRKLRGFHLRVFRFECSAKWKTRSWKTSEFDQSTSGSEFDETTSEQISEVFNSDFSVLGMVRNGKLGVENLGKLILRGFRVFRELRVFNLAHLNDPNPPTATSSSNDHNNSTDPKPNNGRQ